MSCPLHTCLTSTGSDDNASRPRGCPEAGQAAHGRSDDIALSPEHEEAVPLESVMGDLNSGYLRVSPARTQRMRGRKRAQRKNHDPARHKIVVSRKVATSDIRWRTLQSESAVASAMRTS